MHRTITIFCLFLIFFGYKALSQNLTKEQYVVKYYKLAINEMNLYKIPASITLAQGILETSGGQSRLAIEARNHFGIKCQKTWTGPSIIHDDDKKGECFRVYNSVEESYRDHSLFIATRDRYKKLFSLDIRDYKSWAYGLKECGYATNPNYPNMLIKLIEDLKLYEYDNYGFSHNINLEDTLTKKLTAKDTAAVIKVVTAPKKVDSSAMFIIPDNADKLIEKEPEIKAPTPDQIANYLKRVVVTDSFDLDEIAKQHNLTKRELLIINEMENEQNIKVGQNIFLERKKNQGFISIHEAKPGESIYDISQIYGVRTEAIRKYNKIESWEQPQPGEAVFLSRYRNSLMKTRSHFDLQKEREEMLKESWKKNQKYHINSPAKVKPNADTSALYTNSNTDPNLIIHIVKAKETIFMLAKKYGVLPSQIDQWNNLQDKPLQIGQKLSIYLDNR